MTPLLDRRLLIVSGKGGVGKTTVAAALAWYGAAIGRRVLVCELDAKGDLVNALTGADAARSHALTFTPREVHPRLHAMVMDPEASLKEYLKINLRIPLVGRIGALSNAFDFLANAAPGVREIVTIGKLAYEVRERHYDLVIADAPASGHVAGLLRAPQAINELVGVGLIRSQTKWILDILADPSITGAVVVSTSEELPVTESIELIDRLRSDIAVDPAAVVVNRTLPQSLTADDSAAIRRFVSGLDIGDPTTAKVFDGALLLDGLTRARAPHLDRLLAAWTGPVAMVPTITGQSPGLPVTRSVASHLADEFSFPGGQS
jgi:anion-transporting  ArsA/GET3 family ATPase